MDQVRILSVNSTDTHDMCLRGHIVGQFLIKCNGLNKYLLKCWFRRWNVCKNTVIKKVLHETVALFKIKASG